MAQHIWPMKKHLISTSSGLSASFQYRMWRCQPSLNNQSFRPITRDEYFFSLCIFAPCYSADFGPRLPCKIIINNVEIRQVRRKIHPWYLCLEQNAYEGMSLMLKLQFRSSGIGWSRSRRRSCWRPTTQSPHPLARSPSGPPSPPSEPCRFIWKTFSMNLL